jgi:hypothetical protein
VKPFRVSLASFADEFGRCDYIHIKDAVDPDFFGFAIDQLRQCQRSGRNEIAARAIKNKKKQYLFEFPDDQQMALAELLGSIAALTGLSEPKMRLSERHIMIYDENAAAAPKLHKDRFASQISVGIPLEVSDESRIVLLPHGARQINLLEQAVYSAREVDPTAEFVSWETLGLAPPETEVAKHGLEVVALGAGPGDVVVFAGSSIFHGRLNSACSSMLYFKLNAMGLDPLGEHLQPLREKVPAGE